MPSNLIIFDAEYVAELTSRMNTACDLMAEAVSSLRSAQSHENWKCKERNRIIESFDELNQKLGRLDTGVNETTRILGGSVSRFAALESQYESQAEGLSDELTNNYGFRATVRSEGGTAAGNSVTSGESAGTTPESETAAVTAGTAGAAGAGTAGQTQGRGAGMASGIAGSIPGAGRPGEPGRPNTGGETMNVNLPVTHIPDNPGAAAKGTKDTREIAQAAVDSVAETMAEILGRSNFAGHSGGAGSSPEFDAATGNLVNVYNAGRSVFENSESILASPTMPHTTERLAMAAGLVTLAGSTAAGLSEFAQTGGGNPDSGSGSGAGKESLSKNAGSLMEAVQGNSEASEFRSVLGVFASSENGQLSASGVIEVSEAEINSAGSRGKKESYFDKIVSELKKNISKNQDSIKSSLTTASKPIMDFIGNFVMDQG